MADSLFMIDTEPSAYPLGAVLLQKQDLEDPKKWATIRNSSRALASAEITYSTTERKFLSVGWE